MKNFKSLILGSAAGMLAVAGAQAADLPVKAKPVEYVKVCSAYGAGFYYIPGTDICLRVGGFIFSDFSVNDRGDTGYLSTGERRDRNDDMTAFRIRQNTILDARTNTEYGTLRSYFSGGFQWDTSTGGQTFSQANTGNSSWHWSAAFIQFAGFTFGIANSHFDFDPNLVMTQAVGKSVRYAPQIAYTAQLGSGVSATIAVEDGTARRSQVSGYAITTVTQAVTFGNTATNVYAAQYMPDFVANLRVDQAWGDAQIAGAVHQVKTTDGVGNAFPGPAGLDTVKYGYAFMGGLNFKLPSIGAKDSWQIEGVWAKGATEYLSPGSAGYTSGSNLAYVTRGAGPVVDIMDAWANPVTGELTLTKAYGLNTQFRHYWTPTLRSAVMYGYSKFDNPAAANAAGLADGRLHMASVDLIWSPVKNLDIGTEVYYAKLKATDAVVPTATSSNFNGSNDWWGGNFRVTRYW